MAKIDLSKYGITDVKEILHNPSYEELFKAETDPSLTGYEKGQVTELGAENLILMTDISGLLKDKDDPSTLIKSVNVSEVPFMKRQGIISGGMIPKIDCCVEAVRRGVKRTSIIDGRVPHSILIELLSNEGIGTQFK